MAVERRTVADVGDEYLLLRQELSNPNGLKFDIGVGRASALYAASVLCLLLKAAEISARSPQPLANRPEVHSLGWGLLDVSLGVAQVWAESERDWLTEPDKQKRPEELKISVCEPMGSSDQPFSATVKFGSAGRKLLEFMTHRHLNADTELTIWAQATTDNGIIGSAEDKSGRHFELWRSSVEVKNYVCCLPSRRRIIATLREQIRGFHSRAGGRSLSSLIVSRPGAGKTFLVKSLAQSLGYEFIDFNITTLVRREDILACFDSIATAQASDPRHSTLVFFDEINALIDNQHVCDSFLAPLEDGYYVRGGNRLQLHPCIWLFAGTADENAIRDHSKGSDFLSRMSQGVVNLTICPRQEGGLQSLEMVYLGLSLVRTLHPDLRKARESVVTLLRQIDPNSSVRSLRSFLSRNMHVVYGQAEWRHPAAFVLLDAAKEQLIPAVSLDDSHVAQTLQSGGRRDDPWLTIK